MATTQADMKQADDEYSAAYAEPDMKKAEMSEDEAFGIAPPEDGSSDGSSAGMAGTAPTVVIAMEPAMEGEAMAEPGGEPMADAAEGDMPAGGEEMPEAMAGAMSEKDIQREKSWEGRLKAREAELKAREDALMAKEMAMTNEPGTKDDMPMEGGAMAMDDASATEALQTTAMEVKSGAMTVDQAMKQLSDDFGDEFANVLGVLIEAKAMAAADMAADKKMGKMSSTVDEIISRIDNDAARSHFEMIADKHPDFMELADSDAMKDYMAGLGEEERAQAQQVVEGGTARQIVKLLDMVKASAKMGEGDEGAEDPAMAAAEGVRSTGMKLPSKPTDADDYEAAWAAA